MSVLSTRNKLDLAAVFMSLALVQPAAAAPLSHQSKGHADTMPVYGATEDKMCTVPFGSNVYKSPAGNWGAFNAYATARNIVMVTGNDCKSRMMRINPDTLELIEILSPQEALDQPPTPVMNASPAPARWWEKPNFLPAKPQGAVQVSSSGPGGPLICTVRIGTTQVVQARPNVLIIPDATRAFYLALTFDASIQGERISAYESVDYGKRGKPVCALEPLIILPTGASTMTMAGGGLRDPGRITPPAKPAVPAAADPIAVATVTSGVAMGILILAPRYLPDQQALTASGTIIYNFAADRLVAIKNILGLSAEQLGELAIQNTFKDVAQVDDRIAAIKNAPYDARSEAEPPGNCGPEEFRKLDGDVSLYCKQSGQRTCDPKVPPYDLPKEELLRRLQLNQQCVESRERLFQRCFYGGNAGHREKAISEWKAVRKCIEKLNPTP